MERMNPFRTAGKTLCSIIDDIQRLQRFKEKVEKNDYRLNKILFVFATDKNLTLSEKKQIIRLGIRQYAEELQDDYRCEMELEKMKAKER